MAIRPSDAYRLWGRAGGRCSICRVSLTRVANDGVLGEMAHIVARSQGGPRGNDPLAEERRDSFDNLILLCPNDHAQVDRDVDHWAPQRLRDAKISHESWVQEQIDQGRLQPIPEHAEEFRLSRLKYWGQQRSGRWLYAALTPLDIVDDVFDPLTERVKECVKSMQIPDAYAQGKSSPNPYHVESSANGIVAEDFRDPELGGGYRVEACRSGHVEIALSLQALIDNASSLLGDPMRGRMIEGGSDHRLNQCEFLLNYSRVACLAESQTAILASTWKSLALPFHEMVFTLAIIAIPKLCLLVPGRGQHTMGRPLEDGVVAHAFVVDSEAGSDDLLGPALMRIVNAFGFTLEAIRGEDGTLLNPTRTGGF